MIFGQTFGDDMTPQEESRWRDGNYIPGHAYGNGIMKWLEERQVEKDMLYDEYSGNVPGFKPDYTILGVPDTDSVEIDMDKISMGDSPFSAGFNVSGKLMSRGEEENNGQTITLPPTLRETQEPKPKRGPGRPPKYPNGKPPENPYQKRSIGHSKGVQFTGDTDV